MAILPIQSPYVLTVGLLIVLLLAIKLFRFGSREKYLPPGPPTVPILGNAHLLVGKKIHHRFLKWGQEYGSVYSLKIGRGTMIVLNSKRAVYELVDSRGKIYAGRPFVQQLFDATRGENFPVMDVQPLWKAQRKMMLVFLSPSNLDDRVAKISEAEISVLLHDLLTEPNRFKEHIKRSAASTSAVVIYGQRATSITDFWSESVFRMADRLTASITPGSYLPVEQFPILRMIPDRWNSAQLEAFKAYEEIVNVASESVTRVERRRRDGDHRNSLLDCILDGKIKTEVPMKDSEFACFFSTLWTAAADTSAIAILIGLRYLAKYPEVQRKAQAELDSVCGVDRMPTWKDYGRLPYINCIMKEGLRISGVVPLGVTHRATADDWYEGVLIPKDAMVTIPAYVLGRLRYEDGDTYNPDRYINHPRLAADYATSPDYEKRDHYAYGAGRRLCAGIHFAERTQWRIFAKLLWAFRLEPDRDERTGEIVDIDTEAYDDNIAPWPMPFKLRFVPRSEKHAEVVRKGLEDVRAYLKSWE